MGETIILEVAHYRPEQEAEPTFESFEAPFRKDWVVLDALNYIKDKLDVSLLYRWSCRMGVCGSCGMMVNGEPKLTCATCLSHYRPGPVRMEPLRYFPTSTLTARFTQSIKPALTLAVLYRKASLRARALRVPGMERSLTSQLATYLVRPPFEELQNTTLESRMAALRLNCSEP